MIKKIFCLLFCFFAIIHAKLFSYQKENSINLTESLIDFFEIPLNFQSVSLNFSFLMQKDSEFASDLSFFLTDNLIKYNDFANFMAEYNDLCQSNSMICEKFTVKLENKSNFSFIHSVNFPLDRVFLYLYSNDTGASANKTLNIKANITYNYDSLASSI